MSTRDVQSHADRFAHTISKGDFPAAEAHLDAIEAWVSSRRREVFRLQEKAREEHPYAPEAGSRAAKELEQAERLAQKEAPTSPRDILSAAYTTLFDVVTNLRRLSVGVKGAHEALAATERAKEAVFEASRSNP